MQKFEDEDASKQIRAAYNAVMKAIVLELLKEIRLDLLHVLVRCVVAVLLARDGRGWRRHQRC